MISLANILDDIGNNPAAQYPRIVTYALIATAGLLALHLIVSLSRGKGAPRPRWWLIGRLVYLGLVAAVAILGTTAFYSVLAHGAMHGWALLLHLVGAGAFVVTFALVAIAWAPWNHCRPRSAQGACDLTVAGASSATVSPAATDAKPQAAKPQKFAPLTKLSFWLMLVSGVATAGTMLISMLPLLGTDEMSQMIDVHRYAGLVLVIATVVHFYTIVLGKLGRI